MTRKRVASENGTTSSQCRRKKVDSRGMGASEPSCVQCSKVASSDDSLQCDVCELYHHTICCGWTQTPTAEEIVFLKEIGWLCLLCQQEAKKGFKALRAQQAKLAETVVALTKKVDVLLAATLPPTQNSSAFEPEDSDDDCGWLMVESKGKGKAGGGGPLPKGSSKTKSYAETAKPKEAVKSLIVKTVTELNRKKSNIVVSGLFETGSECGDTALFKDVCERFLSMIPVIAKTYRLGKSDPKNERPRLLLVTLQHEK